jgi:tetratricopeptide (TPR) repeat protein
MATREHDVTRPRLPEVESLIERLAENVVKATPGASAAWQIEGPPTAGKSALLRGLSEELARHGVQAVTVAPPAHALDAGPLALVEVGAGMKDAGLLNGETEFLRDQERPLADKIDKVRTWISDHQAGLVLLCDEPAAWPDSSEQSGHFAERARLVIHEVVRDSQCRRIITGDSPEGMRFRESIRIPAASDPQGFLCDAAAWGELSHEASDLAELSRVGLSLFSPLELRLLVAHIAVTSAAAVEEWLPTVPRSRRLISERLIDALDEDSRFRDLLAVWSSLALVRRPLSEELLGRLSHGLRGQSHAILRHCLLFPSGQTFVLHDTLRRDIRSRLGADTRPPRSELRDLAEHYGVLRARDERAETGKALLDAMEASYYAARAGAADLMLDGAFFVDQLDLLGKSLSYDFNDFDGAVRVFRRAIEVDKDDDYAHHYLAYNLDRCGAAPNSVEAHYCRAIELNARHPWWRARYVRFLIAHGRSDDARAAWDDALDALGLPDVEASTRLYETLHGWVARALLERGQLQFAATVLADVPYHARTESPSLTALIRRLRALEIADRDGAFVPSQYLMDEWWHQGPFLLQRRIPDDNVELLLRRWLAGRVELIDGDEVELRVRDVELGEDRTPPSGHLRMSREAFDGLSRDWPSAELAVGRFVEVGLYSNESGERTRRVIRVHPLRAWLDETLPSALPPLSHELDGDDG